MESLYSCPALLALDISISNETGSRINHRGQAAFSDTFFEAFVSSGERGYLCPRLQVFVFRAAAYASIKTIRQFLTGKRKGHGIVGLNDWKKVVVRVAENNGEENAMSQMRDLAREQRAAGLDVHTHGESVAWSEWNNSL